MVVDINVGCGGILLPHVVNIDIVQPCDMQADITRHIPFGDEEVRNIACYHVLEHLVYPQDTDTFLREAVRVMDGLGVLMITTPDAVAILDQMRSLPSSQRAQELRCLFFGTRECKEHHHEWLYTTDSLFSLLSMYFHGVHVVKNADDHGGPGLQASCTDPRKEILG